MLAEARMKSLLMRPTLQIAASAMFLQRGSEQKSLMYVI